MKKILLIITGVLCCVTCSLGHSNTLFETVGLLQAPVNNTNFTVLNATNYQQVIQNSRFKIQQILQSLAANRQPSLNTQVINIVNELTNVPYAFTAAAGEGDWQANSLTYRAGAFHVTQDPVYRLDELECQTFVEVAMALLHSASIDDFDKNFLQIAYGAAGNYQNEYVHFYNRNNFVDGDFNPGNQRNGKLSDSMTRELAPYAKTETVTLTRQKWFLLMQQNLGLTVRVLDERNGPAMAHRFATVYAKLNFPNFNSEKISITYLPKEMLALKQADGSYQKNQALFAKIPTPALVEAIRDPAKWYINNKPIKEVIGSELTVSHMGLLYRQRFNEGEIIFQDIKCHMEGTSRVCDVQPVRCQQRVCEEVMMAHATDRHPNNFYWYQLANGNFTCSAQPPTGNQPKVFCNRVESVPLFNYLTDYQYGAYRYMDNPSILGVHVEQLL